MKISQDPELIPVGAQPMVVHCSAGIGRTGTFITIDHVITAVRKKMNVDVKEIIKSLREDRMGMVQSLSQCAPPKNNNNNNNK